MSYDDECNLLTVVQKLIDTAHGYTRNDKIFDHSMGKAIQMQELVYNAIYPFPVIFCHVNTAEIEIQYLTSKFVNGILKHLVY